jgi:hypothetical protein
MPRQNRNLDAFTRAYIEAALWSSNDESDESGGDPLDKNYGPGDIDDKTMEAIEKDCADFVKRFGHLIEDDDSAAIDKWGRWELAGHDFWLTRNGHGAGFGDWNFPKHDDELYEAAQSYGGFELYVGDDGVIYAAGHEPSLATSEVRQPILRPRPAARSVRQAPPRPRYAGETRHRTAFRIGQDVAMISNPTMLGHVTGFDRDGSVMVRWPGGAVSGVNPNNLRGLPPGHAGLPPPPGFHGALRPGQKRRR